MNHYSSNNINELHKNAIEQKKPDTKDYILYEKLLHDIRAHRGSFLQMAHMLIFGLSSLENPILAKTDQYYWNFYHICLSLFPTNIKQNCFLSYSAFYKSSSKPKHFWHLILITHKKLLSTLSRIL